MGSKIKNNASVYTRLFGLALLALAAADVAYGNEADGSAKTHTVDLQKRPATIDISKYPPGLQMNYKVFTEKCSQCHSLGRAINSELVLPDEWSRCIGRMERQSGSDINSGEGKTICDFLIYDSSVRKGDKLAAKLKALTPTAQKEVEDKIKKVTDKYQ